MLSVSTWQIIGFTLNGAIFIILGLQLPAIGRSIPVELTTRHWLFEPAAVILTLTLCLMGLRYVFMVLDDWLSLATGRLFGRKRTVFSTRMKLAASVAGVRGAVTLAGVLSLPLLMNDGSPLPARDLVIFLATGVIVFWLAIATVILPRLTRGLATDSHEKAALELRQARVAAAQAAIASLQSHAAPNSDDMSVTARQAVADALIAGYRRRIEAVEEGNSPAVETRLARAAEVELRQVAFEAETDALRNMLRAGTINDHTLQRMMTELTLGEAAVSAKGRA